MGNIYSYIKKYKNKTFKDKKFNDIDNMILSMISYNSFDKIFDEVNDNTLYSLGKRYVEKFSFKIISLKGIMFTDPYKILKEIYKTKRYKDIVVEDYVKINNNKTQFCAMTFKLKKTLSYICFEGTEDSLTGWKEDGELACYYPVIAHKHAIKYLKEHISIFGPNIIVGGHSKGGNLALVASMNLRPLQQYKVKKIYSNDGPGLRKKEFNSYKYKKIKYKYEHIVPSTSVIGVLLRNDKYTVVDCHKKNIFSHSCASWEIDDDKLVLAELSLKSRRLERSIISWLNNHSDDERKKLIYDIFDMFEREKMESVNDFKSIRRLVSLYFKSRKLDKETQDLFWDLIKYNYKSVQKGIDEL